MKVYEVTTTSSRLAYTITSRKWKPLIGRPKWVRGVAVSESLPGSMLVICDNKPPYVYQFPCHEATKEIKRYKIQSDKKYYPWRIVANASVAVIKMTPIYHSSLTVCRLPDFTYQSYVRAPCPYDLSISTDYLLVMTHEKMVVRSLAMLAGDISEDLCEIKLPDGYKEFNSVCFGDAATREMYVACEKGAFGPSGVYRYTWDGRSKVVFVNTGCVIDDGSSWMGDRGLSVTSDGLMAVGDDRDYTVKLYNHE